MRVFRLSGELIASELPLDGYAVPVEPSQVAPTITLTLAAPEPPSEIPSATIVNHHDLDGRPFLTVARNGTHHRVRVHGYADYEVRSRGAEVRCVPQPSCPEEIAAQLFVDRVLPNVASHRGAHVFHASVVAVDGKAAAFLGDPGLGKSTLASALTPPAVWLGDDCAAAHITDDGVHVHPSYPFARLFGDSLRALGREELERASSRSEKWRLHSELAPGPQRLVRFFALAPHSEALELEPLSRRDAVTELARHLYRLDPSDRAALAQELDALDRIALAAPVFILRYPRHFADLPRVRDAVLAALRAA